MNEIHNKKRSALKRLERIARNDMIFVFIITVILIAGMYAFGYIVGFTAGRNPVDKGAIPEVDSTTANLSKPENMVVVPLSAENIIDVTSEVPCTNSACQI